MTKGQIHVEPGGPQPLPRPASHPSEVLSPSKPGGLLPPPLRPSSHPSEVPSPSKPGGLLPPPLRPSSHPSEVLSPSKPGRPRRCHPSEVVSPSGTIARPLKRSAASSSSGLRRRGCLADCIGLAGDKWRSLAGCYAVGLVARRGFISPRDYNTRPLRLSGYVLVAIEGAETRRARPLDCQNLATEADTQLVCLWLPFQPKCTTSFLIPHSPLTIVGKFARWLENLRYITVWVI